MSIYCCYKDCLNAQRAFSSKTFFNLPNDSRREIWIKNSGNNELYGVNSTQRRLFCEDHFDPMYLRCQFNRTTLRRDAVPYPFEEIQDSHEIEYIEMEEIEEENEERFEQPETQAAETNDDPNNVLILVNNTKCAQIPIENVMIMAKKPKVTDASASKRVILKKDTNNLKHPLKDDSNEVELELDLIVVEEKKTDQAIESNENGQKSTTRKRLRLEVEPLISLTDESSQKVKKEIKSPTVSSRVPVSVHANLAHPKKSIEEIVSSSEGNDTNSEDKYFALSILGTLRRLTPHKRALAKCHILSYLTEIEYGNSNSTT